MITSPFGGKPSLGHGKTDNAFPGPQQKIPTSLHVPMNAEWLTKTRDAYERSRRQWVIRQSRNKPRVARKLPHDAGERSEAYTAVLAKKPRVAPKLPRAALGAMPPSVQKLKASMPSSSSRLSASLLSSRDIQCSTMALTSPKLALCLSSTWSSRNA